MTTTTANPFIETIAEVRTRKDELWLWSELNAVAAYTQATVASLSAFQIIPYYDPLEPEGMRLQIVAVKDSPYVRRDQERRSFGNDFARFPTMLHFRLVFA